MNNNLIKIGLAAITAASAMAISAGTTNAVTESCPPSDTTSCTASVSVVPSVDQTHLDALIAAQSTLSANCQAAVVAVVGLGSNPTAAELAAQAANIATVSSCQPG
ncbi:hypothetical protein [Nocardia arthritidis]|uniref:DUF732 domain-containing protein n=1 Tax=Nocardia arthritidis TaxID=228602 RepID=A0A6G9YHT5_9NOCA|nr:hypothetical protein [Nocardia arthritidis]QIS12744.1 hypothetical protein F5544_24445 [Nocardia arthritidis]